MVSVGVVLLLQLLLAPLVSTSHYFGASMTFRYKGKNPDGSLRVNVLKKATYDGCRRQPSSCSGSSCGRKTQVKYGIIDQSPRSPQFTNIWCETEESSVWVVNQDKDFQMRATSCCWIQTRNNAVSWKWNSFMDLGTRSDTGEPNKSPSIAILPFLRVPQNCPRTYKLMAFDPDGDFVRCRYGKRQYTECDSCRPPQGFHLDQDSCTLHYLRSSVDPRVFAFEMVVEDFSLKHMDLIYRDGTRSHRHAMNVKRKKRAFMGTANPSPQPWWWQPTTAPSITFPPWIHNVVWGLRSFTTQQPRVTQAPYRWWWSTMGYRHPTARYPRNTQPPATTQAGMSSYVFATQHVNQNSWWRHTTARPHWTTGRPWWWYLNRRTTTPRTTTPYQTTQDKSFNPFSKLPLQFSVLVDPPAPSCQEGVFIPKFVYPTPKNGASITVVVNKLAQIRIKAETKFTHLHDIIISGPMHITKSKTTHNEFVLGLRPNNDDLGEHIPVCFAVEAVSWQSTGTSYTTPHYATHHQHGSASSQSGIYQSEMRCILLQVVKSKVEVNVVCKQSSMKVEVLKSSLEGFNEDRLHLNDPLNTVCHLKTNINRTHIIGVIPLNACGTQIEEDDDNLFFKNEITTVPKSTDVITRKHLLEIQFYCQYPKRGNVTLSFIGHRNKTIVWERGLGTFTYQFEFYPNSNFRAMINPNSYPLEYEIGTRIYMQIEASSSINNTEMFVESCRAAPYDNPNYKPAYKIIDNGCAVDPTVEIYHSGNGSLFQFSLEAFRFIGLYDQVYISCSVLMCEAGNPNTRCSRGCSNTTLPNSYRSHHHHKREAVIQSKAHFISQGPLRLKRASDERGIQGTSQGGPSLNLTLVFIAGCVLAAVGIISGVVVYKTKMSTIHYQRLSNQEM